MSDFALVCVYICYNMVLLSDTVKLNPLVIYYLDPKKMD